MDLYFASVSYDKTARLWSTDTAYPLRIFSGHTAGVDVSILAHRLFFHKSWLSYYMSRLFPAKARADIKVLGTTHG